MKNKLYLPRFSTHACNSFVMLARAGRFERHALSSYLLHSVYVAMGKR